MAYLFAGYFVKSPIERPEDLPDDADWRVIEAPFAGVGVRLPAMLKARLQPEAIIRTAQRYGLDNGSDWLFIHYTCWAGRVDSVYGLGRRGGRSFGPIDESDLSKTEEAYSGLMGEFGVSREDARSFPPFVRGFWGTT